MVNRRKLLVLLGVFLFAVFVSFSLFVIYFPQFLIKNTNELSKEKIVPTQEPIAATPEPSVIESSDDNSFTLANPEKEMILLSYAKQPSKLEKRADGIYYSEQKISDGKNFKVLKLEGERGFDPFYGKDDKYVYYDFFYYLNRNPLPVIEGADPKTFEHLGELYSKDKNHAYFAENTIPEIDPSTFQIITTDDGKEDTVFAKDRKKIVFKGNVYSDFNIEKLKLIRYEIDRSMVGFKDDMSVYQFLGCPGCETEYDTPFVKIKEADAGSFVALDAYFSKDKNNVYLTESRGYVVISGLKPDGLETYEYDKAKNSEGTFKIVETLDPKTGARISARAEKID